MSPAVRLDCLGSGFAYSHGSYWNGFLLGGRVLLDCPPQTLAHLYKLGVSTRDVDLVLLSHEHSDHIGGMDLLLLEAMQGSPRPLGVRFAVAGPPGIYDRLRGVIGPSRRLPHRADPRMAWFERRDGESFGWAGVSVRCFEMRHSPGITALGYRVTIDGRTVAYTGDTSRCPAIERLAEGADLLIVECGEGVQRVHLVWDDIFELRRTVPASTRMLVTHYDPLTAPDVSGIEGLALAEDFATYEV